MKINALVLAGLMATSVQAYCNTTGASVRESFNLSVRTKAGNFSCLVDEKPIYATLSSDGGAVIVSGTGYVPIGELSRCKPSTPIHVRRAAPHVSFLSDINIRAGIYASTVPVAVSPLNFVAVVAKIGSDRNLIKKPGFYRTTVSESRLEEEASSNMVPVISLDGKYVSIDRHQCGSDSEVDVLEIKTGKTVVIDNQTCGRLFNWVRSR